MRDSANDAFFTAESLENVSEALVREAIQNSLDAAVRGEIGERQVRVRIAFHPHLAKAGVEFLRDTFAPVRENFSNGTGIPDIRTILSAQCGCLTFEDFGTRGLTGDVGEYRLQHAEKNAFFSFFRAEGRSAKSGESLGRWGIGKQVFPTASKLHAMFGLTVRADAPERVLMGSAVVKSHSIGEQDYQPDAWFGCRSDPDEPVQPVEDSAYIDQFAQAFSLSRGNAPGLSVVVPFLDERVIEDDLRRGIVRSFFWPILQGELLVEFITPEKTWNFDSETLGAHRELLPPGESAVVEFALWASTAKPNQTIALREEAAIRPIWSQIGDQLLPETKLAEIRSALEKDERVALKVPVRVRPKHEGTETFSSFRVFIQSCRDSGHRPVFLRDGIVITDVRPPPAAGTRSLVVIDDAALAGLLGDAEGVNHTQWQKDSPKFHNRYVYGPDTIKFVTRSVYEVLQRLHAADTQGDPNLLLHVFFLPTEDGLVEKRKKPEPGKPDVSPPPPPQLPPAQPKKFVLVPERGGFVLRPGPERFVSYPASIRIQAGYAVRRGDPIKRWAADDFNFVRAPLRHDPKPLNTVVTKEDGQTLEVEIRQPDFLFGIVGFDTKRDLVIRAIELHSNGGTE